MKKFAVMALAAVMLLSVLAGCGANAEGEASVQSVSMICGIGSATLADRFAGMVTARGETTIKKNENSTVESIKVQVDQEVKKGDALFVYDTSQAQLDLEKAQLELQQMQNELTNLLWANSKSILTSTSKTSRRTTFDRFPVMPDLFGHPKLKQAGWRFQSACLSLGL